MENGQIKENLDFKVYAVYHWRVHEAIQQMTLDGNVLATTADIMRGRLEGKLCWDVPYVSGDAVAWSGRRAKLIRRSADMMAMTKKSRYGRGDIGPSVEEFPPHGYRGGASEKYDRLRDNHSMGSLIFPFDGPWKSPCTDELLEEAWASLGGEPLQGYSGEPGPEGYHGFKQERLSERKLMENSPMHWLADGDIPMLGEYVYELLARLQQEKENHSMGRDVSPFDSFTGDAMGVHFRRINADYDDKTPILRPITVGGVDEFGNVFGGVKSGGYSAAEVYHAPNASGGRQQFTRIPPMAELVNVGTGFDCGPIFAGVKPQRPVDDEI